MVEAIPSASLRAGITTWVCRGNDGKFTEWGRLRAKYESGPVSGANWPHLGVNLRIGGVLVLLVTSLETGG